MHNKANYKPCFRTGQEFNMDVDLKKTT